MRWMAMLGCLIFAAVASAGELHVNPRSWDARDDGDGTPERPLKTITAAAARARAGDTVIVHPGVYAESVRLRHSGTAEAPITFRAAEPGTVVVSGLVPVWRWSRARTPNGGYVATWPLRFSIGTDDGGAPIEHHPEDAPVWGRAEQVFVGGVPLKPVGSYDELSGEDAVTPQNLQPAVRSVGEPFGGVFYCDTRAKTLAIRLEGDAEPRDHAIEASARELLFGITPWDGDGEGVRHVHVSGFIFRGAAGFPQRPAVWLHGADNVVEDCVIESNAGAGIKVAGTLRRCLIRDNGHIGGSAVGDGAVNEQCVWIGNSWEPIDRAWEAGGVKIVRSRGVVFRDCAFLDNGGPGLWLDIDVRDALIQRCVFAGNELSGLFIEISRDISVEDCLAIGNGRFTDDWGVGGITVAESMNVTIRGSALTGNRDGLAVREQGPRVLDTAEGDVPFTVQDLRVERTVGRDNLRYQLAFWWDNPAFGPHPSPDADAGKVRLDPLRADLILDRNDWQIGGMGGELGQWGPPWRPKARPLETREDLQVLGFEMHPADGAGWSDRPDDIDAWTRAKLPTWMADFVTRGLPCVR